MQQKLIINRLYSFVCHLSSVLCRLSSVICHLSSVNCPRHLYICRERSTNQLLFMQNKPNLLDAQMNVSIFLQRAYENNSNWTFGQNKPNSNPIKPNFQKTKMVVNLYVIEDYRKKDDFAVRKNKPNSNPISSKAKMNVNVFITKDYENETALRPKNTNPNKANFTYPQRHALSYAKGGKTEVRCRFSEVRYLSSAFCFCRKASCGLSSVHGHLPPFLAQIQGFALKIRKIPEKSQIYIHRCSIHDKTSALPCI